MAASRLQLTLTNLNTGTKSLIVFVLDRHDLLRDSATHQMTRYGGKVAEMRVNGSCETNSRRHESPAQAEGQSSVAH